MDLPGYNFLARSALAENQHGAIGVGNQFDLASDEINDWARSN
jgi:hypothetical protein